MQPNRIYLIVRRTLAVAAPAMTIVYLLWQMLA